MRRVDILGVGVHAIRRAELIPFVEQRVQNRQRTTLAYANVHVLNQAHGNPQLRDFLNQADLCYCDGNGVIKGAKILGDSLPERMTGADWIWDLAACAEGKLKLYWLGGEPGVTAEAARALQARFPQLEIATDHGFHARSGPENTQCIERINAAAPDIVLVGMGTPVQEEWVAERRSQIHAPVVWCLGATADFISGRVPRVGPVWLIERHEWLSRLLADPKRLWRRYLIGNGLFLYRVRRQRRQTNPSA